MKLYVNNIWVKNIYPKNRHRKVESVELREEETFQLKIQVLYHSEPKCLEASATIELTKAKSLTYDPSDENNNEETSEDENQVLVSLSMLEPEEATALQEKQSEDFIGKDTANTTS